MAVAQLVLVRPMQSLFTITVADSRMAEFR
jgi:hypothetical protein